MYADLLARHNLKIMSRDFFEGLPQIFPLEKIFVDYVEKVIYKILFEKQDEIILRSIGIVKIVQVTEEFVDLELLDTDKIYCKSFNTIRNVIFYKIPTSLIHIIAKRYHPYKSYD